MKKYKVLFTDSTHIDVDAEKIINDNGLIRFFIDKDCVFTVALYNIKYIAPVE